MSSSKLIHVKLEYPEAVESKKEILSLEMSLLKNVQIIKQYQHLRTQELELKLKLHRRIKELLTKIRKIKEALPKTTTPEKIHKEKKEKPISKKEIYNDDIEAQLREIQEKLNSL